MPDENDQERTEDPTPRRRQEAREEGNVARSADLTAAAMMAGLLLLLWMLGARVLGALGNVTLHMLGGEELGRLRVDDLPVTLRQIGAWLAWGLIPLFAAIVVLAVVVNVAQVGFLYVPKKLTPKLDGLNPVKGLGRIYGSAKTYVGLLMNLGKMALAGTVAWSSIDAELPRIVGLAGLDVAAGAGLGARIVFAVGMKVALMLLVLALADYAWQRFSHERQLRMTKQQVKEEMKRMEGDPQIKQRRRQIAMQRAMQRINQDVPTADVVVTNPTHYAVAIKYDDGAMHAPRVVAKGTDLLALRIRELASASGVPIVERPPLARALYAAVDVGREIPEDFYSAVAELLAYVYQLDGSAAQAAAAAAD